MPRYYIVELTLTSLLLFGLISVGLTAVKVLDAYRRLAYEQDRLVRLYQDQDSDKQSSQRNAPLSTIYNEQWGAYVNRELRYSVQYPVDWRQLPLAADEDFSIGFDGPIQPPSPDSLEDGITITISTTPTSEEISLSEWLRRNDSKIPCLGWNEERVTKHDPQGIRSEGIRRDEKCKGWRIPAVRYYFPLESKGVILIFTITVAHSNPWVKTYYLLVAESIYETLRIRDFATNGSTSVQGG